MMERIEKFGWNDGDVKFNLCASCERYNRGELVQRSDGTRAGTCKAFPSGIPREIEVEEFDHHNEYPGDNGLQYKKK